MDDYASRLKDLSFNREQGQQGDIKKLNGLYRKYIKIIQEENENGGNYREKKCLVFTYYYSNYNVKHRKLPSLSFYYFSIASANYNLKTSIARHSGDLNKRQLFEEFECVVEDWKCNWKKKFKRLETTPNEPLLVKMWNREISVLSCGCTRPEYLQIIKKKNLAAKMTELFHLVLPLKRTYLGLLVPHFFLVLCITDVEYCRKECSSVLEFVLKEVYEREIDDYELLGIYFSLLSNFAGGCSKKDLDEIMGQRNGTLTKKAHLLDNLIKLIPLAQQQQQQRSNNGKLANDLPRFLLAVVSSYCDLLCGGVWRKSFGKRMVKNGFVKLFLKLRSSCSAMNSSSSDYYSSGEEEEEEEVVVEEGEEGEGEEGEGEEGELEEEDYELFNTYYKLLYRVLSHKLALKHVKESDTVKLVEFAIHDFEHHNMKYSLDTFTLLATYYHKCRARVRNIAQRIMQRFKHLTALGLYDMAGFYPRVGNVAELMKFERENCGIDEFLKEFFPSFSIWWRLGIVKLSLQERMSLFARLVMRGSFMLNLDRNYDLEQFNKQWQQRKNEPSKKSEDNNDNVDETNKNKTRKRSTIKSMIASSFFGFENKPLCLAEMIKHVCFTVKQARLRGLSGLQTYFHENNWFAFIEIFFVHYSEKLDDSTIIYLLGFNAVKAHHQVLHVMGRYLKGGEDMNILRALSEIDSYGKNFGYLNKSKIAFIQHVENTLLGPISSSSRKQQGVKLKIICFQVLVSFILLYGRNDIVKKRQSEDSLPIIDDDEEKGSKKEFKSSEDFIADMKRSVGIQFKRFDSRIKKVLLSVEPHYAFRMTIQDCCPGPGNYCYGVLTNSRFVGVEERDAERWREMEICCERCKFQYYCTKRCKLKDQRRHKPICDAICSIFVE